MKLNLINKKIFNIRKNIILLSYKTKSAHLGSSLSCVEILTSCFLYKKNFDIILSKGHAAMAYYSTLLEFKKIKKNYLNQYLKNNSKLWAHVSKMENKHFKFGFGSLGYGLGIASGLAIGNKLKKKNSTIFCVISDGELNEGSTWESLSFIAHHNLKNIVIIIDKNNIQSFGYTKNIISYKNLKNTFSSIGFFTKKVNGHSVRDIINSIKKKINKPKIIICKTTKGKGLRSIQNTIASHYIPANKQNLKIYEK